MQATAYKDLGGRFARKSRRLLKMRQRQFLGVAEAMVVANHSCLQFLRMARKIKERACKS